MVYTGMSQTDGVRVTDSFSHCPPVLRIQSCLEIKLGFTMHRCIVLPLRHIFISELNVITGRHVHICTIQYTIWMGQLKTILVYIK